MKEVSVAYITSNIAPFRVDLLDELAKYVQQVNLFYSYEIEQGVNKEYVKKRPKYACLCCMQGKSFGTVWKEVAANDVIIFDGYTGRLKIKLMIACILLRKNYLVSVDGIIPVGKQRGLKNAVKSFLLGNAVHVFSTNQKTDDLLRSYSKKCDIKRHMFTTLTQSDFDRIKHFDKGQIRKEFHLNEKDKVVLFVGKFLETKGVSEFLESARVLPYTFVMVGGTKEQLSPFGKIPENVKIIHFLEKHDILRIQYAADLFVLPTYSDVWGLVIIEALSCGTPIITTDRCNAGVEFIRNGVNGFVIPIRDAECLRMTICKAFEALNPAAVRAYDENLMGTYTLEKSAQNYVEVLAETVSKT